MSRKLKVINSSVLVASLAAFTLGVGPATASQPSQPATGTTWTSMVGHAISTEQGEQANWQSIRFFPETITIKAGDSITWEWNSGNEAHNVVFLGPEPFPDLVAGAPGGGGPPADPGGGGAPGGPPGGDPGAGGPPGGGPPPQIPGNPKFWLRQGGNVYDGTQFINSGVIAADIPGPKNYTVSFPKAGTYLAICTLHAGPDEQGVVRGMVQNVVVQEASATLPKTQAQYNAENQDLMQQEIAKAREYEAMARAAIQSPRTNADGTRTYHVLAGFGNMDPNFPLTYLRFAPEDLNLNVGDTVEWTDPIGGFHNVIFGDEPALTSVEVGPDGQPTVLLNLVNFIPAGGPMHTGTGFYNSGILAPPGTPPDAGGPFPSVDKYSLTFSQAGRYEYVCSIHYLQGMDGFVNVAAGGGGQPGMPRTGSGEAVGWLYSIVALGLALAASGAALRLRRGKQLS